MRYERALDGTSVARPGISGHAVQVSSTAIACSTMFSTERTQRSDEIAVGGTMYMPRSAQLGVRLSF
jgi:hypothetical protein